ncbi:hypothetical protein [uncultured Gimesia sp.]|uniref:hypothetical protein n=1 Tax=uncultured Gimesia sp. TaxID=1678688 RepID=UPI0030DD73FA|tara:strand:+ start:201246 stop:201716 length:471 start_codon:yes stop_codon:yes gene_type:complete
MFTSYYQNQRVLLFFFLLLIGQGCGGGPGNLDVAKVSGKVTCEGKPVTQGSIAFTPITDGDRTMPGKPALSKINSDGTFQLTTYEQHDGAVVGKHKVSVTFPGQELGGLPGENFGDDSPPVKRVKGLPSCAYFPRAIEIEVKAGEENTFNIELSDD